MNKPKFDSIKTYEEFRKYSWSRPELSRICREHGLLFVGSEKKLRYVIESYFNGVKIPPRRNWYTNVVLNGFVNENGLTMPFDFGITIVSVILCVIGIIRMINGTEAVGFMIPGVLGLIIGVIGHQQDKSFAVIRSYGPACGDRKFTRAQVDEQANAENAVNLGYEDIILAPDMLIGVSAGIAAVAYEDISSLQVKRTQHSERYRGQSYRNKDYYIYEIIVRTRKGKKVVISKSRENAETAVKKLYTHCLRTNPKVRFLVEDNQVTSGEKIKSNVEQAVTAGKLTSIAVSEDTKKRFARFHTLLALDSVFGSILVSGSIIFIRSLFVTSWLSFGNILFLLIILIFPFFMIRNFLSVISLIRKNDIDFYSGEISQRYDDGYVINGVSSVRFGFIGKMRPETGPDSGDRVILARLEDRFSLISYDLL